MKIFLILTWLFIISQGGMAQNVAINTTGATADASAMLDLQSTNKGFLPPRVSLASSTDAATIATPATGLMVYNTNTSTTTGLTGVGLYMNTGTTTSAAWKQLYYATNNTASVIVGGSIYCTFAQASGGTIASSSIINSGSGTYTVGTTTGVSATVGGITGILGSGYTVSNPSNGIFDIKFNTPFARILGFSVSIYDVYGNYGPDQLVTSVSGGQAPILSQAGAELNVDDNAQISYLSTSLIRVKTGDSGGNLGNRAITFVVSGQ